MEPGKDTSAAAVGLDNVPSSGVREFIEGILQAERFGILATQCQGQPHVSLVAITPRAGVVQLVFATYRDTQKYRNLLASPRVAVLIGGRDLNQPGQRSSGVLTAHGQALEIAGAAREPALLAHLQRHPDLEKFLGASDCALVRVTVDAYQCVRGIDDAVWWTVDPLACA
jgi:hypothetical protein